MQLVLVYLEGVPVGLVLLVWAGLGARNPFPPIGRALAAVPRTRGGRRLALLVALLLVLVLAEALVDPHLGELLPFHQGTPTAWIHGVEGDLVARIQSSVPPWAVDPASWLYMAGYVAGLLAPVFVWQGVPGWSAERRASATATYALAFAANVVLALPFYVLVPVQEVAWSGLSAARPLLEDTWPGITAELRAGSALDNCFPSLHVSCTITAALIAQRFGPRALALVMWTVAAATAWVVMALGIHWALDVAAGVPFALACARVGALLAAKAGHSA